MENLKSAEEDEDKTESGARVKGLGGLFMGALTLPDEEVDEDDEEESEGEESESETSEDDDEGEEDADDIEGGGDKNEEVKVDGARFNFKVLEENKGKENITGDPRGHDLWHGGSGRAVSKADPWCPPCGSTPAPPAPLSWTGQPLRPAQAVRAAIGRDAERETKQDKLDEIMDKFNAMAKDFLVKPEIAVTNVSPANAAATSSPTPSTSSAVSSIMEDFSAKVKMFEARKPKIVSREAPPPPEEPGAAKHKVEQFIMTPNPTARALMTLPRRLVSR